MGGSKHNLSTSSIKFFDAVYSQNLPALRAIVKREKVAPDTVDTRTDNASTALLYAAENRLIDLARALLKLKPVGADVNKEDSFGRRPIWWAAQYGDVGLAELLIKEYKCEVDYMDRTTGCTPLYRAIVTESPELCTLLIHGGADVNLRRLGFGTGAESPLIKAVQLDNLPICQVLVNSLCNLSYQTEEGFTALHYAIAYRRYSIVEFLLENKINMHATSHGGITPMCVAITHSNPAMVRYLIMHGYNMNKVSPMKVGEDTPLGDAISLHNQECALALVHWGCSLRPRKERSSYFELAAEAGLGKLLQLLVYVKPFYANEWKCKYQKGAPLALQTKSGILQWLRSVSSSPLPLKELSRAAIFNALKYFPSRYVKLPLPRKLLEYISFHDIVDQRMYRHQPLKVECPMDCSFHHSTTEIQCPDVEVSDLDGETDYGSDDSNNGQ
ncbi:putative ankyrin repeat protein RF_0381 [Watersipora subatra]|uniref:putative ankyrin repeat protein RF_0381 n=1 Tax=Watersipora subatra TaxID=2589382 RepID=UPI00355B466F